MVNLIKKGLIVSILISFMLIIDSAFASDDLLEVYSDGPLAATMWGSSCDDIFVGGYMQIHHYDGLSWSLVDIGKTIPFITGIWGSSSTDVYVVGFEHDKNNYQGLDGLTCLMHMALWKE